MRMMMIWAWWPFPLSWSSGWTCGSGCRIALGRPILGVGWPLGMLMTVVSRHRRPRWQLRQWHRCLRERTWRSQEQPVRMERKWCAAKRPARMEWWLCSRGPRHPGRMGFAMKQLDWWNQAMMMLDPWMMLAITCDCTRQTANIYIVAQQGLSWRCDVQL